MEEVIIIMNWTDVTHRTSHCVSDSWQNVASSCRVTTACLIGHVHGVLIGIVAMIGSPQSSMVIVASPQPVLAAAAAAAVVTGQGRRRARGDAPYRAPHRQRITASCIHFVSHTSSCFCLDVFVS